MARNGYAFNLGGVDHDTWPYAEGYEPTYADTFAREDLTFAGQTEVGGAVWQTLGDATWGTASGRMGTRAGSGNTLLNIDTARTAGKAQVDIPALQSFGTPTRIAALCFRVVDINNFFFITARYNSTNSWGLVAKLGGVNTNVRSFDYIPTAGDRVTVEWDQNTIIPRINGDYQPEHKSTSLQTATRVGFLGDRSLDMISRYSNFKVFANHGAL